MRARDQYLIELFPDRTNWSLGKVFEALLSYFGCGFFNLRLIKSQTVVKLLF